MQELLKDPQKRVVGTKQVLKAIQDDRVSHVFLGKDADGFLYHRVNGLCEDKRIPLTIVDSMAELGSLCRVDVKTASAAVLK